MWQNGRHRRDAARNRNLGHRRRPVHILAVHDAVADDAYSKEGAHLHEPANPDTSGDLGVVGRGLLDNAVLDQAIHHLAHRRAGPAYRDHETLHADRLRAKIDRPDPPNAAVIAAHPDRPAHNPSERVAADGLAAQVAVHGEIRRLEIVDIAVNLGAYRNVVRATRREELGTDDF